MAKQQVRARRAVRPYALERRLILTKGVVGVTSGIDPLLTFMGWHPSGPCVVRVQLVDATQALNLSAGVSYSSVR